MARAMEDEDTIPCEHCNTQISLHAWPKHVRQCVRTEKRPLSNSDRYDTEETASDGIPCEYCQAQISLNDWKSHSEQCADSYKRRIERLKNGFDDESTIEHIPCEYCNQPVSIHELEWHSRQCANNNNRDANNTNNLNTDEPMMEPVIPCEYCGGQVSIHDYAWHIKQCGDAEKQRLAEIMKHNEQDENNNLIPCEYCDKSFALQFIQDHQTECRLKLYGAGSGVSAGAVFGGRFPLPDNWDQSSLENLSVHTLQPDTEEYKFVEGKFHETLPANPVVQIERIQNRRWYRQYDAHRDDFIERYGQSTEQWLFHGCKSQSTRAIMNDCFNRSHAVRCAVGQGIYFATQASTSLSYTQPDAGNLRHMFMARVLVGKTTGGTQATRVCPPGYDTTGGGTVFVTYHDAQAYGEYLITFR